MTAFHRTHTTACSVPDGWSVIDLERYHAMLNSTLNYNIYCSNDPIS